MGYPIRSSDRGVPEEHRSVPEEFRGVPEELRGVPEDSSGPLPRPPGLPADAPEDRAVSKLRPAARVEDGVAAVARDEVRLLARDGVVAVGAPLAPAPLARVDRLAHEESAPPQW